MILQLFKKSFFSQIAWVMIFAIIFALPGFFQTETEFLPSSTLFLQITCFFPWLKINWIYQLISSLFLVILAFFVKNIFSQNQLVHHQNLIPSLLILALFNFLNPFSYQLTTIISLYFLALSFSFLLQSFDDDKPDNSIFSAALLLSIGSLFSYSLLLFIPLIWISFFIFQNYSWRYFPMTIIGFITPYLFLAIWLFWHNKTDLLIEEWNIFYLQFYHLPQINGLFNIIILSILGFFIFSSLAKIVPETPSKIIAIRRKTNLSLWFLLFSLYPLLFYPDSTSNNLILIPLSGLLGYYLRVVKRYRLWIDFLFSILIILLVFNKYFFVYASKILLN